MNGIFYGEKGVEIPCAKCSRSDSDILGPCDGAREVVGQVHGGLDGLAELDHDHVTQGVAILGK